MAKCLHEELVAVHTTKNGTFWACSQKPSCNFFCSEKDGFLYEQAIARWKRLGYTELPRCPIHLTYARMKVVKDITKDPYGRPFFVCGDEKTPCAFWMWGDVEPNPPCHHGYPSKERKVKKGVTKDVCFYVVQPTRNVVLSNG